MWLLGFLCHIFHFLGKCSTSQAIGWVGVAATFCLLGEALILDGNECNIHRSKRGTVKKEPDGSSVTPLGKKGWIELLVLTPVPKPVYGFLH